MKCRDCSNQTILGPLCNECLVKLKSKIEKDVEEEINQYDNEALERYENERKEGED